MIALGSYTYDGLTMTVRDNERGEWDRGIVKEVATEYLWNRINWTQVRYAVDVGGHIGAWTMRAKRYAPHAQIVAVEPMAENYVLLSVNTHDELRTVTALHGAVYYHPSAPPTLKIAGANSGGHVVITDGSGAPIPDVWTLEQVCEEHGFPQIDVLKLDCEGSEHNILHHMTPGLLRRTRWIVGEFHCTAEQFMERHAARLTRTHEIQLVPHPNKSVKDLGMFFMENREWQPTASNS